MDALPRWASSVRDFCLSYHIACSYLSLLDVIVNLLSRAPFDSTFTIHRPHGPREAWQRRQPPPPRRTLRMLARIINRCEGERYVSWRGLDLDNQVLESYSLIAPSCQSWYLDKGDPIMEHVTVTC